MRLFCGFLVLLLATDLVISQDQCPHLCICNKVLTSVNCDGKGLKEVPADLPMAIEKLYLSYNEISEIPQDIFSKLIHLQYVALSHNRIPTVPSYTFGNLTNLKTIKLDHNVIGSIFPFAFAYLKTLISVDLRQNQITQIMKNAFNGCPLLQSVILTTNYLEDYDIDAFEGARSVNFLSISANRFKAIPEVKHLVGLQTFVMEGNNVRNATFPSSFLNVTHLNLVVLSNNPIGILNNNTFRNLRDSCLRRLEITRCNIRSVDSLAFTYLNKLQSLRIGLNPLDSKQLEMVLSGLQTSELISLDIRSLQLDGRIPSYTFGILRNSSLKYLMMPNNKIKTVPDRAFANLPKLLTLDLQACQIDQVSESAFENLTIKLLFLSDNSLTSVPSGLPPSLEILHLNGNNIDRLGDSVFSYLTNMKELYLTQNGIHELHEGSFIGLQNLKKLHLQRNKIATLPHKLFISLIRLISLEISDNNLKAIQQTPGLFSSLSSLIYLNMANNQIHSLPDDLFSSLSSVKYMILKNNNLGPVLIENNLLRGLTKLEQLDLSSNNITYLPDDTFMELASLKILDLTKNKISFWGRDLFASTNALQELDLNNNLISTIPRSSMKNLQSVQHMNLSHNPFACTCSFQDFCQWMKTTKTELSHQNEMICNSPSSWHTKKVSVFCSSHIDCTDYTLYKIIGGVISTVIFYSFVGLLLHRHRWFIQLRWYRMKKYLKKNKKKKHQEQYQEIPGDEKVYDAYISMAEEDREWVANKFLPNLDNGQLGGQALNGNYKFCFPCRDYTYGKPEISNFDEALEASKHVYIILTQHYVDSPFCCEFQFPIIIQTKLDGKIEDYTVVKVGKLPPKSLPKQLERILERREFIEWPDVNNVENEFKEQLINKLENLPGCGNGSREARYQNV